MRSAISYHVKKTDELNSKIQDVEDKINEIENTLSMPPNQEEEDQPFEELNQELYNCIISIVPGFRPVEATVTKEIWHSISIHICSLSEAIAFPPKKS